MATYKKITLQLDGVSIAADSVVLGSSDGLYGIKLVSDDSVAVADGVAVLNPELGEYKYDVSNLTANVEYQISWRVVYDGQTQYIVDTFTLSDAFVITANDIFELCAGDIIGRRTSTGIIDVTKTAKWKNRVPGILTIWQTEMAIALDVDIPDPIMEISDAITINDRLSGAYFLASKLLIVEDPSSASYYEQKFEDMKKLLLKRQPQSFEAIEDVYPISGGE